MHGGIHDTILFMKPLGISDVIRTGGTVTFSIIASGVHSMVRCNQVRNMLTLVAVQRPFIIITVESFGLVIFEPSIDVTGELVVFCKALNLFPASTCHKLCTRCETADRIYKTEERRLHSAHLIGSRLKIANTAFANTCGLVGGIHCLQRRRAVDHLGELAVVVDVGYVLVQRVHRHEVQVAYVCRFPQNIAPQLVTITKHVFCKVFGRTVEPLELQGVLRIWILLASGDTEETLRCGQHQFTVHLSSIHACCGLVHTG